MSVLRNDKLIFLLFIFPNFGFEPNKCDGEKHCQLVKYFWSKGTLNNDWWLSHTVMVLHKGQ